METPRSPSDPHSPPLPRVACYCATFLKPEMWHIYRQITGLRRFEPVVFAQKREHAARFPIGDLRLAPKPRTAWLRRIVVRQIARAPVQLYRGEARRLARAIAATDAKLLHVFFGHIGVQLLPLLELHTLPSVVSFHGADVLVELDRPKFRAAMQRLLAVSDRLLVRSESLRTALLQIGADSAKIRLHRTGLPLDQFPFSERTPPVVDGAWRCLQVGRLIAKKGIPTTLRAFAHFHKQYPHATLTLAGEGPLLPQLIALVRELDLAGAVTFPGFLNGEALLDLYRTSHFFLHPSELGPDGNQEGVPNSLLEAMATGLPPLATHHGGIPEAITHGRSGHLVAERDHQALGESLVAIARDPLHYAALSQAAAQAVRENFDLTLQTEVLESIYTELTS